MDTVAWQHCKNAHSSFDTTHLLSRHIHAERMSQLDMCLLGVSGTHIYTYLHIHTAVIETDIWLCEHTLSNLSLSLNPPFLSCFCPLQFVCVKWKMNRVEEYSGRVLEQRREQRSYDWRRTASRTAWSKAASAWPFGCGSPATLISIQIKVDWFVGLSLLVVQC